MSRIIEKLQYLELILKKYNAPVLEYLNPGLSKKEVDSFLQLNNISPVQPLTDLYEWHNGIKTVYGFLGSQTEFLPSLSFFNMNEMYRMKEFFMKSTDANFKNKNEYIPILGSGEDDMLLLQLSTGQLYFYAPIIQIYGELEFNSLESMLDCIIECFEKGVYSTNPVAGLTVDIDQYNLLKTKYI